MTGSAGVSDGAARISEGEAPTSEGTPRLSKLDVAALSAAQLALYESITGGSRATGPRLFSLVDEAGRLEGPFDAMLRSPALGGPLSELGSAVRYRSAFTDHCREIAILVVGNHWRSEFEIYAHEAVARSVGLTERDLAVLRDCRPDLLDDPLERLIGVTAAALAVGTDLTDDEYAAAIGELGESLLFELTTLVGYYATLALQLRVFRVGAPR